MAGDKKHRELTEQQKLFCSNYVVHFNAAKAAVDAKYSERTAKQIGFQLLRKPQVQAELSRLMSKRLKQNEVTVEAIKENLSAIAYADPAELMELRRNCCRYCWGEGNRYQYTAGELERARESHEASERNRRKEEGDDYRERKFDPKGGDGYHPRREPNPDCPECFGEGVVQIFIQDTRKLSPQARRLFAGIKTTRDGLEIKTHNQQGALEKLGQHVGMFPSKVEHSGKIETGEKIDLSQLTDEELAVFEQLSEKLYGRSAS